MNQAFGRTARQGNEGSVRIICLHDQFISPIGIYNKIEMEGILNDFKFKNDLQQSFINIFMLLLKIAAPADFSSCGEYISELFEVKILYLNLVLLQVWLKIFQSQVS